jgi:HlyD family secretion protein
MHRRSSFISLAGAKPATVLVAFSFFVSCGTSRSADEQRPSANVSEDRGDAVTVLVAMTESRPIPAFVQATGSLVADEKSNIAPKTAGKIANIGVNVGDFVVQGAVIARIDDRDARLQLASARASVKQAQAAVRQAEARLGLGPSGQFDASSIPEVRAANANHQQALAELRQAEANEKRYRELVETGDVAMIAYEQFRTNRDTARARANLAKEQLDAAINTARQSNEAIRSAEA